jgi:hypothetical protein
VAEVQTTIADAKIVRVRKLLLSRSPSCTVQFQFESTNTLFRDPVSFSATLATGSVAKVLFMGVPGEATSVPNISPDKKNASLVYTHSSGSLKPLLVALDKCDSLVLNGSYLAKEEVFPIDSAH